VDCCGIFLTTFSVDFQNQIALKFVKCFRR